MGLRVQYYTSNVLSTITTKHSIKPGEKDCKHLCQTSGALPLQKGLWATLGVSVVVSTFQVVCIEHSIVLITREEK